MQRMFRSRHQLIYGHKQLIIEARDCYSPHFDFNNSVFEANVC